MSNSRARVSISSRRLGNTTFVWLIGMLFEFVIAWLILTQKAQKFKANLGSLFD
jgi:hypothetical protein